MCELFIARMWAIFILNFLSIKPTLYDVAQSVSPFVLFFYIADNIALLKSVALCLFCLNICHRCWVLFIEYSIYWAG
jgi:hypothetical protein